MSKPDPMVNNIKKNIAAIAIDTIKATDPTVIEAFSVASIFSNSIFFVEYSFIMSSIVFNLILKKKEHNVPFFVV